MSPPQILQPLSKTAFIKEKPQHILDNNIFLLYYIYTQKLFKDNFNCAYFHILKVYIILFPIRIMTTFLPNNNIIKFLL